MATTPTLLTQTMISLEEYLRTSYHPDCDFVDEEIKERHLGELPHSTLQLEIGFWFRLHRDEWRIVPLIEQRIRVSPTRVRICDVCVLRGDAPRENVTFSPPLLCIEILSPEDRIAGAAVVLGDYLVMGVPNIWLIDPAKRIAYTFDSTGLHQVDADRLELPNSPIHLVLPDLFAALD